MKSTAHLGATFPEGLPPALDQDVVPSWAMGVLRSSPPNSTHAEVAPNEVATNAVFVELDPKSGLVYMSAPGFHVVAVDPMTRGSVLQAIKLALRLKKPNPLDVGMLALSDDVRLPAHAINRLAAHGVIVSRLRATSALDKAKAAVSAYLELRLAGHRHLDSFIEASRGEHEAQDSLTVLPK